MDVNDLGIQTDIDAFHLVEHLLNYVLGWMEGWEQPVPLRDMASKGLAFFNNDRIEPHFMQLCGCFHSGGATANNQYILFHKRWFVKLISYTTGTAADPSPYR